MLFWFSFFFFPSIIIFGSLSAFTLELGTSRFNWAFISSTAFHRFSILLS